MKEETKPTVEQQEDRKQPWHTPTLRRANITFDTSSGLGPGSDGLTQTTFAGPAS